MRIKSKIMLPLAVLAILAVTVGAVSLTGLSASHNDAASTAYRNSLWANELTPASAFLYNGSYNATAATSLRLDNIANVEQCRTTFADNAAPIVSTALKINIDTSALDSANARLQSNVSDNASMGVIMANARSLNNNILSIYWQAMGADRGANQTQLQNLKTELNGSIATLRTCVETNAPAAVTNISPFRGIHSFGFRGHDLRQN